MKKKKCTYDSGCQIPGGCGSDLCIAAVGGDACVVEVPSGFRAACKKALEAKLTAKAVGFVKRVVSLTPPGQAHPNAMAIHEDPWHQ